MEGVTAGECWGSSMMSHCDDGRGRMKMKQLGVLESVHDL